MCSLFRTLNKYYFLKHKSHSSHSLKLPCYLYSFSIFEYLCVLGIHTVLERSHLIGWFFSKNEVRRPGINPTPGFHVEPLRVICVT